MISHPESCCVSEARTVRRRPGSTRSGLGWFCQAAAVLLRLVIPAREAFGHHSFAMYDTAKVVVIKGTVKEFQWTNPHALLWVVSSPEDGGASDLWTIELPTSPGNLARMGWTKHSLRQGDALAVEINPLRDGSHGGSFKKATLTNSGVVLVATAKDDPYAGDASAGTDAASAPNASTPDGESGGSGAASAKTGCSVSNSATPQGGTLQAILALALAGLVWARETARSRLPRPEFVRRR